MTPNASAPAPTPFRPPALARSCLLALALGACAGAALGAFEGTRWAVLAPARGFGLELRRLATAIALDALIGALAALLLTVPARFLARAVPHRAAPDWACAGVGAALGLAAWIGPLAGGWAKLAGLSLAGLLAALVLRELLDAWPLATRARTWLAVGALGLALGLGRATWDAAQRARPATPPSAKPNVLLISIDTLRADRVGAYGGERAARTPTLDGLARDGVLFLDATSQANTTGPSHSTMLTGLLPAEHGAVQNGVPLRRDVRTLADVLGARGWRTAAFVSGFTLVDALCGLGERFEHYDDDLSAWSWVTPGLERVRAVRALIDSAARRGTRVLRGDRPAAETIDRALAWYGAAERGVPTFAFVHLYDPHAPYEPPAPFAQTLPAGRAPEQFDWYELDTRERAALVADPAARAHMEALYRGEIEYADAQVGRLLEALERRGELENTLVVLTSDHGEGLGSHGYFFDHGTFLYDEELHVPLILRLPQRTSAGLRVGEQVRLLDLAPTVLELVGAAPALECAGSSLAPLCAGNADTGAPRPSFASSEFTGEMSGFELDGRRLALRRAGAKVVWTSEHWLDTERVPERWEAYDLVGDAGEQHDLVGRAERAGAALEPRFEALREELSTFRDTTARILERGEPDPETAARLRGLGY